MDWLAKLWRVPSVFTKRDADTDEHELSTLKNLNSETIYVENVTSYIFEKTLLTFTLLKKNVGRLIHKKISI